MLLKIMERKNLNKGYDMSDRLKIKGLEDVSPNLRKFVKEKAAKEIEERPKYKKYHLDVMFYKGETRLLPTYKEDEGLEFFRFYDGVIDDSIDKRFPYIGVYLRFFESVTEETRLSIGIYNVVEDKGIC